MGKSALVWWMFATPDEKEQFYLEFGHLGLDIVGLVPGVGEIADGTNCALYTVEGWANDDSSKYIDAALSCASMIPIAGYGAAIPKALKWSKKAEKLFDTLSGLRKKPQHPDLGGAGLTIGPDTPSGSITAYGGIQYWMPTTNGLRDLINPNRYTTNCMVCAVETDGVFAGRPGMAAPNITPQDYRSIERVMGRSFRQETFAGLVRSIDRGGNGARGIIFGQRNPTDANPEGIGHFFNVINRNGKVLFIDAQSGQARNVDGYDSYKFMRTDD